MGIVWSEFGDADTYRLSLEIGGKGYTSVLYACVRDRKSNQIVAQRALRPQNGADPDPEALLTAAAVAQVQLEAEVWAGLECEISRGVKQRMRFR